MRVLVLCTHNSARSQMAEGWLRLHAAAAGLALEVGSAGTVATRVRPEALTVMAEVGVDLSGHRSKTIAELPEPDRFDLVWTVCDAAAEACPVLPGAPARVHLSVEDPSGHDLARWRAARDRLGAAASRLVAALAAGRVPSAAELEPAPG